MTEADRSERQEIAADSDDFLIDLEALDPSQLLNGQQLKAVQARCALYKLYGRPDILDL